MKASIRWNGRVIEFDDARLDQHGTPPTGFEPVRRAYAAAHVVMRPAYAEIDHSSNNPGSAVEIAEHVDWATTLRLRQRLDDLGLGVAEAMDTAQRFELGWTGAKRLIEDTSALGLDTPFIAGASTDHLASVETREDLIEGVSEQITFIREKGGEPILLPMTWLSRTGADAEQCVEVYGEIVRRAESPLWVHWLGEMFLPELAGYFPDDSFERVMALDRKKIRGVKISLLDADREVAIRRALSPNGQVVFTGDDFHFAGLIAGDEHGYSHALLGILDAVARPASRALAFLAAGQRDRFLAIMRPCEALGRHVFAAPTTRYKAGLAFLSWLNGLQDNAMLPNHLEESRDVDHYVRCAELANAAGAIEDAACAAERLEEFIAR